jgi:pyruvate dehydrogenase E2 component (dihydrolipoamide acetyltransferase)
VAAAGAPATAGAGAVPAGATYTDIPLSNIRKVIANRLTQSKTTIPHYYLTIECRIDKLMKLRSEFNAPKPGEKEPAVKISVNDFIIKAAALACRKVPDANSSWQDTYIRRFHNVDINVAVSTDQGLLTPLVADADKQGLQSIASSVKALADKGKQGKLSPAELSVCLIFPCGVGLMLCPRLAPSLFRTWACLASSSSLPSSCPRRRASLPLATLSRRSP